MKLLMIATALLVLSGCTKPSPEAEEKVQEPSEFKIERIYSEGGTLMFKVTDKVTGCQYFSERLTVPFTPRLNHLGKPICNSKVVMQ